MRQKITINDYEGFDVSLDDDTLEPLLVIHWRVVWSGGDKAVSKIMSERVRRAIESAKRLIKNEDID
jgi:hypothetical protein